MLGGKSLASPRAQEKSRLTGLSRWRLSLWMPLHQLAAVFLCVRPPISGVAATVEEAWMKADDELLDSHLESGMCLLQKAAVGSDLETKSPVPDFSLMEPMRPQRRCHAKVVVDTGLPRTGTYSFGMFMSKLGYTSYHNNASRWHLPAYNEYSSLFKNVPPNGMALSDDPWAEDGCEIRKNQPARMEGQVKYVLMHRDNATEWRQSLKTLACQYWAFRDYEMLLSFCDGQRWMAAGWRQLTILPKLGLRWCQTARQHGVREFCESELQTPEEVALESNMAQQYIDSHVREIRGCIPNKDLLEVHLHSDMLESKVSEFLGCHGPVPPWPESNASHHE